MSTYTITLNEQKENGTLLKVDLLEVKKAALVLRALNHKLRQQILKMIDESGKMTVTELYVKLRLEQSVASQHLAILREKGVNILPLTRGKGPAFTINSGMLATEDFLTGNAPIVQRVVKQLVRASAWASQESNREALIKLYAANSGNPELAFQTSLLPCDGVGLARMEFVINEHIKVHPMAVLHPERIADEKERALVLALTAGHRDGASYFIERLAEGIDHAAQQLLAHRHLGDAAGSLHRVALADLLGVAHDGDADVVLLEVERDADDAVRGYSVTYDRGPNPKKPDGVLPFGGSVKVHKDMRFDAFPTGRS